MSDQITLAKAMGWSEITISKTNKAWTHPDVHRIVHVSDLPDPFTDANDCEAVIRFMAEKHDVIFTIWYPCADQTSACCSRDGYATDTFHWHGEDWKQGVCELALKVLDTDREGQ